MKYRIAVEPDEFEAGKWHWTAVPLGGTSETVSTLYGIAPTRDEAKRTAERVTAQRVTALRNHRLEREARRAAREEYEFDAGEL